MKAVTETTSVTARSFPVLLLTSVGIPLLCSIVLGVLIAFESDYAMPAAFFSLALSGIALVLGIIGLAWGEGRRSLFVASVAASALVVYCVTLVKIR